MNNIPRSSQNRSEIIEPYALTNSGLDSLPTNANSSRPLLNSVREPNASLFGSPEAREAEAARGRQAGFPGPGLEGISYANSEPTERRPEWNAFYSKVVDGVLTLEGKLDAHEMQSLAEWLKSSPPEVHKLELFDICFGSDGAGVGQLAKALEFNTTVISLEMISCNLGDAGVATLAGALKRNHTLTTLDFEYNYIGEIGAAALAEALKVNHCVTSLSLNNNRLSDAGAAALAETLKWNKSLTTLSLWANGIQTAGAAALAEALKANQTVNALFLDFNYIQTAGAGALAEALKTNKSLATLGVARNGIQVAALVEVLEANTALTTLDISGNRFADSDLARLAQSLRINTTLTTLALRYYTTADKKNPEMVAVLKRNKALPRVIEQAGVALHLASGQQYPAELMPLIAGQFPLVPSVAREAAWTTLQQLSASVETSPKAD